MRLIKAVASANIPIVNMMFAPGQCMSLNREPIIVIAIPNRNKTNGTEYCFFILFPLKVFLNGFNHLSSDVFLSCAFNSF